MKKICIIGTSNLINISLISIYTKYFDKNAIDYDIIYWDRLGIDEVISAKNVYKYQCIYKNIGVFNKIINYIKYRIYIQGILKTNNYDFLILWQTSSAYLIFDILLKYYKKKYIVNIRDYIVENKFLFRRIINLLLHHSILNTVSSKGFLSFLPKEKYYLIESINENIIFNNKLNVHYRKSSIIKIGYVGTCRYFEENKLLIDRLGNDNRFELWFCGSNSNILKDYAELNHINNVYTVGTFLKEDTINIVKDFDIINSCFGNNSLANTTLVPIRLFTALSQGIPVMASKGTFLSHLLIRENLGISIDSNDEKIGDYIANYIENIDYNTYSSIAHNYILKSLDVNKLFENKLDELFIYSV